MTWLPNLDILGFWDNYLVIVDGSVLMRGPDDEYRVPVSVANDRVIVEPLVVGVTAAGAVVVEVQLVDRVGAARLFTHVNLTEWWTKWEHPTGLDSPGGQGFLSLSRSSSVKKKKKKYVEQALPSCPEIKL